MRALGERGLEAEIVEFEWTGLNSALARETAAYDLASRIKRKARACEEVHLIGHSHGGNVANDAARLLRRRRRDQPHKIASMTTVGTPFFKSGLSFANTIGWWALLGLLGVGVLMFGLLLAAAFFQRLEFFGAAFLRAQYDILSSLSIPLPGGASWTIGAPFLFGANLVTLALIIPSSLQGARRMLRVRARRHGARCFLALWHPNDEAISFLQAMDTIKTEALPSGSMWRASRMTGLVIGVRAVFAIVLAAIVILALGMLTPGLVRGVEGTGPGGQALFFVLLGAPILYATIYVLVRLVGGVGAELVARPRINRWVVGLMRGMAFGRDGEEQLAAIAVRPHAHQNVQELKLEGEVAVRMKAAAQDQATALIARYRWALFDVHTDSAAALSSLARDAMTWQSLIHTTYFDQPEVAAAISAFIADNSALAMKPARAREVA